MTQDRIKDLANKGFITQVETLEKLEKMSEAELVAKGYITQTGIFDGVEETIDEVIETPIEDDMNENEGANDDNEIEPDDAPLVDDNDAGDEVIEDEVIEDELPE